MKKLILSTVLAASTAVSAFAQDVSKVVTVVTSADPQTQLMSMVLTMQAPSKVPRHISFSAARRVILP